MPSPPKQWPLPTITRLEDIGMEDAVAVRFQLIGCSTIGDLLRMGLAKLQHKLNIPPKALNELEGEIRRRTGHTIQLKGYTPAPQITGKTMSAAVSLYRDSLGRDLSGEVEDYFREMNRQPARCRNMQRLDDEGMDELYLLLWGLYSPTMPSLRIGPQRRGRVQELEYPDYREVERDYTD